MSVYNLNYAGDRVTLIACGAHYSVCHTELGLLFFWGVRNPDDKNTISWYPQQMGISIPKSLYINDHQMLLEFHLTCLKASLREIVACDSTGRVYSCTINDTLTLKPYSDHRQREIGSASNILCGRSTQLFFEQLLSLSSSKLVREPSKSEEEHKSLLTFETLVDNKVSIRLCDTQDNNYYLPSAT